MWSGAWAANHTIHLTLPLAGGSCAPSEFCPIGDPDLEFFKGLFTTIVRCFLAYKLHPRVIVLIFSLFQEVWECTLHTNLSLFH